MGMTMVIIPHDLVQYMIENCPGHTDEKLQPAFGISYNTWRRIRQGQPLRRSVAERLMNRLIEAKPAGGRSC